MEHELALTESKNRLKVHTYFVRENDNIVLYTKIANGLKFFFGKDFTYGIVPGPY